MILNIVISLLIIFLCYCYWLQTRTHTAKLVNKFPQIGFCLPFLGHVYLFSSKPDKLFSQLRRHLARFNQTFAIWGGIFSSLNIVTVDDAEIILSSSKTSCLHKGLVYLPFHKWLQQGLLVSSGKKWQHRRKMLTPAFHYNILQVFVDIFGEHCDNLIQILKEESTKPSTSIKPILTKLTLATICESSMGLKLDQNNKHLDIYWNALHNIAEIIIKRLLYPWLHADIIYNISPLGIREKTLVKDLHKFSSDVIENREKSFRIEDVLDLEGSNKKPKKRLAMLDLLLFAKKHLGEIDDEGIREEVDTFIFTGHDTISAATTFSLMTLAHHSTIQEKIITELDEIFGDSKRHASYEDLQNMKYLERCIKECLRLYPSAPFIGRRLLEDVQLTHHVAPAGSELVIHIYEIHRNPKYFPDPLKFDPDRFLPENSQGRNPFSYIPFSAGPRNCIGQRYAMLQMKSIISSILRNFKMEPITSLENLTFFLDVVLNCKEPIYVKFVSR